MLDFIQCLAGKHRIDRSRVREHHGDFFGPCLGCGKRLFRDFGGWRPAARGDSQRAADAPGEGKRGA